MKMGEQFELRLSAAIIHIFNAMIGARLSDTHTGAMKLQHYGLFYRILGFQHEKKQVTTSFLVEQLDVDRSALLRMIAVLEDANVICKKPVQGKGGRGRTFEYFVKLDQLQLPLIEIKTNQ